MPKLSPLLSPELKLGVSLSHSEALRVYQQVRSSWLSICTVRMDQCNIRLVPGCISLMRLFHDNDGPFLGDSGKNVCQRNAYKDSRSFPDCWGLIFLISSSQHSSTHQHFNTSINSKHSYLIHIYIYNTLHLQTTYTFHPHPPHLYTSPQIKQQPHTSNIKMSASTTTLPRRALIAVTSAQASLFNGKETTGVFISEALHPFNVLTAAGFEVDLASETGTYTPDWLSQQPDFLAGDDLKAWEDKNSAFRQKLDNMPKAADLDASRYGLFYASAGHAALIDYPTASGLQAVATQVWANGGVVASVCHGPAIFANVLDTATGAPLIQGKTITGFTSEAEDVMGLTAELKAWGQPLVEELAEKLGATYKRSAGVWDDFHVVDGRLVTGQNPASASSTARAAVEVFNKL